MLLRRQKKLTKYHWHTREYSNYMVLFLSGAADWDHFSTENFSKFLKSEINWENLLEMAKLNLQAIRFGVMENMQASLALLEADLNAAGVTNEMKTKHANANRKKATILDSDIQMVREHNQYDLRLYKYAVELFQERYSAKFGVIIDVPQLGL